MSACFINGTDKKTDTERSLGWVVGLDLGLLCDFVDESLGGMMAVMSVPVIEAFGTHVFAKMASIGSESSNSDTHVIINVEDLFLMAGQIMRRLLERDENLKME